MATEADLKVWLKGHDGHDTEVLSTIAVCHTCNDELFSFHPSYLGHSR